MSQTTPTTGPLTVVLVHGAFADASSWTGVIERLQKAGVQVTAPANPLRGISIDSAYIASVLNQIPGPVLAVGQSYGGAVISNAATRARNVVGLVYVAAFAADLPAEQTALMAATQRPVAEGPSPRRPGCRPGRPCLHGPWSLPATRRLAAMLSVPWLSGPGRRSPRSKAPT